jgi:hypothetical protein
MVEKPLLQDEWERAGKGQLNDEESEQWKEIGRLMRESQKVSVVSGDGEPRADFWNVTLEYAREMLGK